MGRYAEKTSVSSEKSRMEIERTLMRYGATAFMYGTQATAAMIAFEVENRRLKFELPLPDREDFQRTPANQTWRTEEGTDKAWEQGCRQRWRALALVIKAKLEAVETGITEFEEEFLAHIVLPDGKTVGQFVLPQVAIAYETGQMPPMLPMLTDQR